MKKALIIAAVVVLPWCSPAPAHADIITLDTQGIVGVNDLNAFTDANNPTTRLLYATLLIGMGTNQSTNPYPVNDSRVIGYKTGPVDYSGTFVEAPSVTNTNVVPDWAGYVLAKYDGPNAGYVLFYMPDYGSPTLPATAGFEFWDPKHDGSIQEYGLSGYTVYSRVPDGGSLVTLLGIALIGLAGARRFMK